MSTLIEITDARYRRGQVWTYQTRPGEERSRVVIGRVDRDRLNQLIVHVAVFGIRIPNPHLLLGFQDRIAHAPMAESALRASLDKLTLETDDLEGFDDCYADWRAEYDSGEAGIFTVELSTLPDLYERLTDEEPG